MDSEDTEDILKTVYENAHIQSRTYTFDMARDHISAMKNEMQHIAYLADISNDRLLADYEKASDIPEKYFWDTCTNRRRCMDLTMMIS